MVDKSNTKKGSSGWIYILTNQSMPGLVKIGRTSRSPYERMSELSSATGVPTDFQLVHAVYVSRHQVVEKLIHSELHHLRVSGRREFFRLSTKKAVSKVEKLSSPYKIKSKKDKGTISRFAVSLLSAVLSYIFVENTSVEIFKNYNSFGFGVVVFFVVYIFLRLFRK